MYNRPMDIFQLFTIITASVAGAAMGCFLLLTLIDKPVLSKQLSPFNRINIQQRFYRLNSVLCLLAGLIAALVNKQQSALFLAIIAVSYVFTNMHIIKGIKLHVSADDNNENRRALHSLYLVQNFIHFVLFMGCGWSIYLLY